MAVAAVAVAVDWGQVLRPNTSLLEIIVRGTIVYLALFALLRAVLRRQNSAMGVTDLLVIVLIADAAQNAMAGSYTSVSDGVVLVAVIVFWAWFLDFLSFHVPTLERLLNPPRLKLVEDGRPLRRNMRRELVTMDELMASVRERGIEDLSKVKAAYMESDGQISVIAYGEKITEKRERRIA
jgi:uncharacterized membrane protein YcaP (DUF421 family)